VSVTQLTVTEDHLDRAIENVEKGMTSNCLVAQAAKDAFPGERVSVGVNNVKVSDRLYMTDDVGFQLILDFDYVDFVSGNNKDQLDAIRRQLPVALELTLVK
jgi:hypothetical protein